MDIKFDKYDKRGAYHWKEFNKDTKYRESVLFIKSWIREGDTLDVGAGDGLITHQIDAVGIDDNEKAVKLAQNKGANVIYGDACNLMFYSGTFDNILFADVIEHIKDYKKALYEARRVLRDDGMLYVVTPPKIKDINKYHYREWTPDELKNDIEALGYRLSDEIIVRGDLNRMYAKFYR